MLLTHKPLNSFNGVNWGSRASMALPVGPTYHEIHLKTNLKASDIRQVAVVLNGDTIVQVTGDDLVTMENYKGRYVEPGKFVIPFSGMTAKNQTGFLFGGLVTLANENISLEIEIASGSGTITLDASAYTTPAQAVRYFTPQIKRYTFQANAEGWNDFTTFPANKDLFIRRMYLMGDVNRLRIDRDNVTLFDVKADMQAFQQKRVGRFPQPNVFTFDPTMYGFEQADVLNTGYTSEFVIRTELLTAAPVPILVESIKQTQATAVASA